METTVDIAYEIQQELADLKSRSQAKWAELGRLCGHYDQLKAVLQQVLPAQHKMLPAQMDTVVAAKCDALNALRQLEQETMELEQQVEKDIDETDQ